MSWLTLAQRWLPFLARNKPSLPRHETLALRPIRNPTVTWERKAPTDAGSAEEAAEAEPGLVLHVPRRVDGARKLLARILQAPAGRKIELDEFGAEIWELCDGAHSVDHLVTHTCGKYHLNRRQGEVSVNAFMRMLAERRLIGFSTGGKEASHVSGKRGTATGKRRQRAGRSRRH